MRLRMMFASMLLAMPGFLHAAAVADIPFQKFVLDNGLTVVVHEDHKAPIVCINIWYHVGSKNERIGRTGLAHLFEHLMFSGSEHVKGEYSKALEEVGATEWNGATDEDRTHFYENVPTSAVEYALWMESDRMGYLLSAFDQKKLDTQRGVVENEKRQRESQPYSLAAGLIAKSTYPIGHPYSWAVLGELADLDAVSIADAQEWFKTYYGPSNAVIVLAGDIDMETAKEKVKRYFGDISPGPPISRQGAWIAKMTGTHRQIIEDRVPQARIYKVWNIPEFGSADGDYLDMVSSCLSRGKTSRLYKRLVNDDQIATAVSASAGLNEIGGQFVIQATVRLSQDIARVEREMDEELARFVKDGPTSEELQRVKTQHAADFFRSIEKIGGSGGKSDRLAEGQVFRDSPEAYAISLNRVQEAKREDLKVAASRWLSDGVYILEIHPFPEFKTDLALTDHSRPPKLDPPPDLKLPKLQRITLANGLRVILAERHEVPMVDLWMTFDAGYAADQFASPGTANMVAALLDGGTQTLSTFQISDELAKYGAALQVYSNVDLSVVRFSMLRSKIEPSLSLFADIVLNPSFPDSIVKQEQQRKLAAIKREQSAPYQIALRIVPALLYGPGHPYGNPLTGSGSYSSVTKITRADLATFHQTWFRPNNATLIVVGDITLSELVSKLNLLFAEWVSGVIPKKEVATVSLPEKPMIYLVDTPGATQSTIITAQIVPPTVNPREIAIEAMNDGLGGSFTSRLNLNLREERHWSYGVRSRLFSARGQRPFLIVAPVQADKTRESMTEIYKELCDIVGDRPLTADEMERVKASETLSLPGSYETLNQFGTSIVDLVRFDFRDDYYQTLAGKIRALTLSDLDNAAKTVIHPNQLIWIVIGDRKKIESDIKELGWGSILFLNVDGKVL